MKIGDPSNGRQSEAPARPLADLGEQFEHPLALRCRDADALIDHPQMHHTVDPLALDPNLRSLAGSSRLQSILDQLLEHYLQVPGTAPQGR